MVVEVEEMKVKEEEVEGVNVKEEELDRWLPSGGDYSPIRVN